MKYIRDEIEVLTGQIVKFEKLPFKYYEYTEKDFESLINKDTKDLSDEDLKQFELRFFNESIDKFKTCINSELEGNSSMTKFENFRNYKKIFRTV